MKLKTIVIDDEPLALGLIESYVSKTPFLEQTASFSSAIEAVHSQELKQADLIFLDIQMPTLNGLEFSKMIDAKTRIIFTTAFHEYALDSYKVNALDYLLKPISYMDFLSSANKALDWFTLLKNSSEEKNFIYVKSDYKLLRIELDELLYVEGMKDYVKFYVEGTPKPIISLMNLKKAMELLSEEDFIRVSRSFIVRKDKIKVVERARIIIGDQAISIGDAYKEEFKKFIDN
ncbi:MAG: LytTR family DNA-binding domain-containing protein [Rikenellaceae bacterium]